MDGEHPHNPADLSLVTLDYNPLLALRNNEDDAPAVRELLDLYHDGLIVINVPVTTAMEAQREEERLDQRGQIAWIESLGIAREHIDTHPRPIGFATPDEPTTMTFGAQLEVTFAQNIHTILHPEILSRWWEYRDREGENRHLTDNQKQALRELDSLRLGPIDLPARPMPGLDALSSSEREELARFLERLHRKWFNAKNDCEAIRIHITSAWYTTHPEHAVFVTSDKRLHTERKRAKLRALGYQGEILPPAEAVTFLRRVMVAVIAE